MSNDTMMQLKTIRQYHSDRDSLYHPELGPSIFGLVDQPSTACTCAELARLAYVRYEKSAAAKDLLASALAKGGFEEPACFSKGGSQAFAAQAATGQLFIAFRGTQTDDLRDLIQDIEFAPVAANPYPGMVHKGFADALAPIWAEIEAWIGAQHSPLPPMFTGHSLGAAMATLAAARMPESQLITFGSPRVGNKDFAESFTNRDVKRYVDCCDAVTMVPFEEVLGFKHVGSLMYIDRKATLSPEEPSPFTIEADRLQARVSYVIDVFGHPERVLVRDFADHAPANYIRVLI